MSFTRIKSIQFDGFRGLGAEKRDIKLNGKNYLVVGGNGKGKSSIADGLELFFRGNVEHLGADLKPLKNIHAHGIPRITIYPRNGDSSSVTIIEENDNWQSKWMPPEKGVFSNYPSAESFILRRQRLREFILAKPGERFKTLMNLLGMSEIVKKQEAFQRAHSEAKDNQGRLREKLKSYLKPLQIEGEKTLENLQQALQQISELCTKNGLPELQTINDLPQVIEEISKRFKNTDRKDLDAIFDALISLNKIFPVTFDEDLYLLEEAFYKEQELLQDSSDGQKYSIIKEGIKYFENNPNDSVCPLCRTGNISPTNVLNQLKEREKKLAALRSNKETRAKYLKHVENNLLSARNNIHTVIKRCSEYMREDEKTRWEKTLEKVSMLTSKDLFSMLNEKVTDFDELGKLCSTHSNSVERLKKLLSKAKKELEDRLEVNLINLHTSLKILDKQAGEITKFEKELATSNKIVEHADNVRQAFNRAYDQALNSSLDRFKDKIIEIYQYLHEGYGESPECANISLISTRGRSNLLNLKINFFGEIETNPESYLSEGHLDSLGLAIYLASVIEFNPKGTLLVLDDVVSSIDSEHQSRLAEYIISSLNDYQLIVTTHDKRWGDLLQSKADSVGKKKEWEKEQFVAWTPEKGPTTTSKVYWDHIESMLSEEKYMRLGGLLRIVTENFMKRFILKQKMYLPYKSDNRYTIWELLNSSKISSSNDNTNRFNTSRKNVSLPKADNFRDLLLGALLTGGDGQSVFEQKEAEQLIMRVFGVDNLINELNHASLNLFKVSLTEVKDFAVSLKEIEKHCVTYKFCAGEID